MSRREWTEKEFLAFKEWEKKFDRPIWWMVGATIFLPIIALVVAAATK